MDTACNFALMSSFDALHDITWSFQYSLCGPPHSTGGFTTFLYDASTPVLTGGGVRSGLCYGPCVVTDDLLISPTLEDKTSIATPSFGGYVVVSTNVNNFTVQNGLSGAMLGVGFDSTGMFAAKKRGFLTGTTDAIPNSIAVRTTQDFVYQDSVQAPFSILERFETYRTLRFNLTDLGQTINIHVKNNQTGKYDLINSFDTGLLFTESKMCKIGMSFASPVVASYKACLKVKDFHYHCTPQLNIQNG